MFGITWNFLNATLALAIIFAVVFAVFYFKLKRDKVSDFDKSLWHLRLSSYFVVALLFAAMLFLPHAFYRNIDPTSGQDTAWRDLILNQQRMAEDLHQFQEILSFVFMMSAAYLVAAASIIGRLYRERRKKDDPRLKKPLGLETN
jgi:amino acid transporter